MPLHEMEMNSFHIKGTDTKIIEMNRIKMSENLENVDLKHCLPIKSIENLTHLLILMAHQLGKLYFQK